MRDNRLFVGLHNVELLGVPKFERKPGYEQGTNERVTTVEYAPVFPIPTALFYVYFTKWTFIAAGTVQMTLENVGIRQAVVFGLPRLIVVA